MRRVLVVGGVCPSARALALADLVELRLDLGAAAHVEAIARAWTRGGRPPCLVTMRSVAEGGAFRGTPAEAARALVEAAAATGAGWVDAEGPVVDAVADALPAATRVLASQHRAGPVRLSPRAAAWKVARRVDDGPALAAALDEARALARGFVLGAHPPAFVVPYGAFAAARVVTAAIAQGAGIDAFVYGAASEGGGGAGDALAGVPCLATLVDEGRLGEVSGRARLYGLVGRPPSRSPSPALHNAVFRALGVDAVYLPEVDLDASAAAALPYRGFGVTTPAKETLAARCDALDPLARRVGAVNTVVRDAQGGLVGRNTDALAVREAVHAHAPGAGGGALVVGGGGFARAAVAALVDLGFGVRVVGGARAARLARDLAVEHAGAQAAWREGDRVLVNATPIGADGRLAAPFDALLASAPAPMVVVDAPYAPGGLPAAVAVAAAARGFVVEDGGALLVRQAAGQALAFAGRAAPAGVLAVALARPPTVALVGSRGVGKTTVGRLVARRLGRPFVDTDDALARVAGLPAGRVLATRGEAAFRALEQDVALAALARDGAVVALGGGAVTTPALLDAVRDHAFGIHLTARVETAVARTAAEPILRPPLTDAPDALAEARQLEAARAPLYAAAARRVVATDDRAPEAVADDVVAALLAHVAAHR